MFSSSSPPFSSGTAPFAASVLVVDDVPEIRRLLQQWLRDLGCITTGVSTGDEAVRFLRTMHLDLIVTDILMPDGDGLDVIMELKRIQPTARIVAMSGGSDYIHPSECLKWARGLGADAGLQKPFNRQQFLDAAMTLVATRNALAALT